MQKAVLSLSKKELQVVMSLPSLRRHIESLPTKEEKHAWIKNDEFAKVSFTCFHFFTRKTTQAEVPFHPS